MGSLEGRKVHVAALTYAGKGDTQSAAQRYLLLLAAA